MREPAGGGPSSSTSFGHFHAGLSQCVLEDLAIMVQPVRRIVERSAESPFLVEVDQRDGDLDDREPVLDGLDPDLKGMA